MIFNDQTRKLMQQRIEELSEGKPDISRLERRVINSLVREEIVKAMPALHDEWAKYRSFHGGTGKLGQLAAAAPNIHRLNSLLGAAWAEVGYRQERANNGTGQMELSITNKPNVTKDNARPIILAKLRKLLAEPRVTTLPTAVVASILLDCTESGYTTAIHTVRDEGYELSTTSAGYEIVKRPSISVKKPTGMNGDDDLKALLKCLLKKLGD